MGENKIVLEAKLSGIFFHRVLACGRVTFSVNAINNSIVLKLVSQPVSQASSLVIFKASPFNLQIHI